MKNFFKAIFFLPFASSVYSQQLSQVTFSDASHLSYFSFLVDQEVLIRMTDEGKIIEWGTETQSLRSGTYYAPKLQAYLGRVEYYGNDVDSAFRGKVKSIGTCTIAYYSHYEEKTKVGKPRSLGTLMLDYYSNFDDAAFRGKLRFAGNLQLEYNSSLADEAYRGKLKTVGSTPITYYSTFDDKLIKGKIKNIGSFSYTWYTSYDRSELRGAMKSGLYRQNIGSVTYILR
jgi:hypothetical protein